MEDDCLCSSTSSSPLPEARVLVVDDETSLVTTLCQMLAEHGYAPTGCASGPQALSLLHEEAFDILLTDLQMPTMDGLTLLHAALEVDSSLVGIIMTGRGTIPTAVEAMQLGALDYVLKPFTVAALLPVLTRALHVRHLRLENLQLRETVALYDLSLAVTRTLDVSTLLRTAAEVALQVSKAEAVAILLPTDEGQALTVAVARGKDWERLTGQRLPLRRDGAGQEAPASLPETAGMVEMDGFAVPLLMGGNWLGEIRLAPPSSRPGFTIGDRKALDLLANIAAPALESAKLHTQVQAAEERYRQLVGYLQTVRENEKARVAREIHDELGYALTAVNLDLAALRNLLPKNHKRLREKAYAIGTELETTMRTVQRIATELRPGVLDHVGLAAAIEWQTQELCTRAHLHYQFTSTLEDDRLLTQQHATAIYRIFQEALTNIARHANATTVEITLAVEAGHVVLRVGDNGKGISLNAQGDLHSFGLLSMRERAAAFGGEVLITGIPDQGTTVTARIPLRPQDMESERSDDPRAHCG